MDKLSKFVLFNLHIEELIALCCYFDIDFKMYIYYNNKVTNKTAYKLILIDILYNFFLDKKIPNKVILKHVSYKKEKLFYDTLMNSNKEKLEQMKFLKENSINATT